MPASICKSFNKSFADCSILLTFDRERESEHVTPDVPQTFRVRGQKLRPQRDVTGAKSSYIINNLAEDC